jgi:hypothetical protein
VSSFSNLTRGRVRVEGILTDVNGNIIPLAPTSSSTSTVTSVADQATTVQLLAANTARVGASIQNDSTEILYVKLGTTASLTDYTVKMVAGAYYEVPFGYTGRIDGIWANNSTGAALVDELT